MKVLLVSADGTESGFDAWKAELEREGVPYKAFVAYNGQTKAATLTDDQLADYAGNHAYYQAVILATGDVGHNVTNANGTVSYLSALTDPEWAALAKFERSFGIRQLSNYTAPTPAHGLSTVGGAIQDGAVGQLTDAGRSAFPYLKGPVAIANDDPVAAEAFGYIGTPVAAADWQTLVAAPAGGAYLGIYTHPDDGREEMVMTVAGNQNQNHDQLLRHGMLNWVTRGVFLGYQRNYLELQVDDLFLGDDSWDPVTHTTNFDPVAAIRMTPSDVDQAIAWSRAHGIRIDMVFNGGGSELYKQDHSVTQDPLADKFADPAVRGAFYYINHTYDHPNIDCSTAPFIAKEIQDNRTWAAQHGLPLDPAEVVTGEHSGLANSRPGNPGTIDPPFFDTVAATAGGAVGPGTYDYALTASSAAGETTASVVPGIVVAAPSNAVTTTFNAICHSVAYTLYRSPAGANAWTRVATMATSPTAPTDNGQSPIVLTLSDTQAAGVAGAPPAANAAAIAPYAQNPNYLQGLALAQIGNVATDASKTYPQDPLNVAGPQWPQGSTFAMGNVRTVPRYPSNVYYNVSKQGQQLDEYNWIYVAPANGGGCVPVTGVTTCRTVPATWQEYVDSETRIMFRHVTGNDPRPHYLHQSNLADWNPSLPETDPLQGGIMYPVIGALLARYEAAYDRTKAPLLQLSPTQIADTLARQDSWATNQPKVTAWLQDGRLHVRNTGTAAIDVPLTGTGIGDVYGGQRSSWTTLGAGAELDLAPSDPANTEAPMIAGTPRVGEKLTASSGGWSGTGSITYSYQWQRCSGSACANIPGARDATYSVAGDDDRSRLRVVVTAANWISAVSQAVSASTTPVGQDQRAAESPKRDESSSGRPGGKALERKLSLTRVRVQPRTFAVAHRRAPRGTRLDGTRISWRLDRAAKVRLRFERRSGRHWVKVGTITRSARAGTGVVRFTGRFGRKLLAPRRYRVVVSASAGGQRTPAKRVGFRVVKG